MTTREPALPAGQQLLRGRLRWILNAIAVVPLAPVPSSGCNRSLRLVSMNDLCQLLSVMTSALVLLASTACASALAAQGGLADYLAIANVVVEGRLLSSEVVTRPPAGGCGVSGLSDIEGPEYVVRVDRVIAGSLVDSVIRITALAGRDSAQSPPGTLVLAYGNRLCTDAWRLWGEVFPIDESGRLRTWSTDGPYYLEGHEPGPHIPYGALRTALNAKVSRNPTRAFEGSKAVAILRIRNLTISPAQHMILDCDSLGWGVGSLRAIPTQLEFFHVPWCFFPRDCVGDTLVIPVPAVESMGHRLDIHACPRGFLVDHGFLPSLGVPYDGLEQALRSTRNGLRVRAQRWP